jgi:hypothetical protein
MDPITIAVIAGLVLLLVIRIFFGLAKMIFKLGVVILIAIILWRLFST